ncbi:phage tail protein [Siccirubricoccus sp. G192]|uniref:phage tail protein n=1 Tax=Siccirubricoccus sp. G192 TaxID=2849651 RepID=UPI001C2CA02F|nr:phage tail protein [Siccirubricoccus sp. G192]MBV1800619.1 phage tail protein [Siccirubricoccus sp. G192]MBV1800683.1 phage tail protein [Siccirubricoccus sp. G192]
MTRQQDPYRGFRFLIEFERLQQGGFSRVKGLASETKVESYREGGVNDFEHRHVTQTSFPNIVLEHGLTNERLWEWHRRTVEGRVERKTLSVILRDANGDEVWRLHAHGAYPVKWSLADLDASSSAVLVESVEFAHHGLRRG